MHVGKKLSIPLLEKDIVSARLKQIRNEILLKEEKDSNDPWLEIARLLDSAIYRHESSSTLSADAAEMREVTPVCLNQMNSDKN